MSSLDRLDKFFAGVEGQESTDVVPLDRTAVIVDAMFERMEVQRDDSAHFLRQTLRYNETTDRIVREKQLNKGRVEDLEGYPDLEPFKKFFDQAIGFGCMVGAIAVTAAIEVGRRRFKRTNR